MITTNGPPSDADLLRNSIDLGLYLNSSQVRSTLGDTTAPALTPYLNLTQLSSGTVIDWLNYADAHGYNREDGFLHSATAPYAMNSTNIYPGTQSFPVRNFWDAGQVVGGVYSTLAGQNSTKFNDGSSTTLSATPDDNIFFGYAEPFDELNWTLTTVAAGGWTGVLEYVSAVDANNIPTAWTPMTLISDTTSGLTASGKMHFFPFPATPAWVKSLNPAGADPANGEQGSLTQPGYYMRLRTTHTGTPPTTTLLTPADYTGQGNVIASGSIPVFDSMPTPTATATLATRNSRTTPPAKTPASIINRACPRGMAQTSGMQTSAALSSRRGQCIMPMRTSLRMTTGFSWTTRPSSRHDLLAAPPLRTCRNMRRTTAQC